jgi:hypothetical protein
VGKKQGKAREKSVECREKDGNKKRVRIGRGNGGKGWRISVGKKEHGKGEKRRENGWEGDERWGKQQGKGRERAVEWREKDRDEKKLGKTQETGGRAGKLQKESG